MSGDFGFSYVASEEKRYFRGARGSCESLRERFRELPAIVFTRLPEALSERTELFEQVIDSAYAATRRVGPRTRSTGSAVCASQCRRCGHREQALWRC